MTMSSKQSPSSASVFFHRLGQGYLQLIPLLGLVAGGVFGLMAFFICVDVLMRNLAGKGIGWVIELMEYGMLVATALAAPWVLREGGHVSVDIVSTQLPGRWGAWILKSSTSMGMLICATIFYYSANATWQALEPDSMVVKTFVFPEWWINALIPLCMLMMVVEFGLLFRSGAPTQSASVPPTIHAG